MKIPTATELLDKKYPDWDSLDRGNIWENIEELMIEFAIIHREAILKAAEGEAPLHCSEGIRNCYPIENVK
jgi:hypothetical protein